MTVPSVGSRDQVACELANLEYERSGRLCETEDFYADADRVLSVLHEGGTQGDGEVLRVIRDDNGYTIMLPGDGQWASSTDPRMLESYLALRLSEVAADVGLPALAPDNPWVGPSAEAGTQEDGLDALARQFKNGQTVVWGDGPTQQGAVVGFGYTIPERPGGPDRPALVVRERWGERTGHVLPSELDAHAAVSGSPDTKEDAL